MIIFFSFSKITQARRRHNSIFYSTPVTKNVSICRSLPPFQANLMTDLIQSLNYREIGNLYHFIDSIHFTATYISHNLDSL